MLEHISFLVPTSCDIINLVPKMIGRPWVQCSLIRSHLYVQFFVITIKSFFVWLDYLFGSIGLLLGIWHPFLLNNSLGLILPDLSTSIGQLGSSRDGFLVFLLYSFIWSSWKLHFHFFNEKRSIHNYLKSSWNKRCNLIPYSWTSFNFNIHYNPLL